MRNSDVPMMTLRRAVEWCGGIDALGIRIESFVPGRWRFADETLIRNTEAPQYW